MLPVIVLWLSVSGCGSARDTKAGTFRAMTYNIHHGEGLDGKVDLARIASLIQRERVDLVALQEVDKGVERTARRDLGAELAQLTGMQCVFSNNYHHQGGEYGNAVLTRLPVKQVRNHLFHMRSTREQRGLLQLVVEVHGQEVNFWNTHLDAGASDAERWSSVAEITALASAYNQRPLLICGDFNDAPTSRVYQKLAAHFDDAWARVGQGEGCTAPAAQPTRRIDYFWLAKNRLLTPKAAWLIKSTASDHLPVVAEFELIQTNPRSN